MAKKKLSTAGKALAVALVFALIFAVSGSVFISASADTLGTTIYVKTTKTTTPYLYYWGDGGKPEWPGKAMTSEGDNVFSLELPYDIGGLTGIIVCKDGGGDKLTENVTNITGNLYDVDGGTWSMRDTSGIKIISFGGNLESPQYVGASITLSMDAEGGSGDLQYKISVSGTSTEVLSDYSSNKSVVWSPTAEGTYKVLFEVKDGSGETNSRTVDYEIKDAANAEDPIFLSATPANGSEIQKGGSTTVTINGAGGKVNNNILFYKAEVFDASGSAVNTPYYTTGNRVTFTPDKEGEYTVKMYIQNNTVNNKTVDVTYTFKSTSNPISDTDTTVNPVKVASIALDKAKAELKTGESTTLAATVSPSNADDKSVKWTSSNEAVATVSNGKVTAVAEGTAVITATTNDGGFKAECTVVVSKDVVTTDTQTDTQTDSTVDTQTDTQTDTQKDSTTDTQTDSTTDTSTETTTEVDTDILGDVDRTGKVELKDAYILQSAAIGKIKLTNAQIARGDVNHDGVITLKDASKIQRASLGLENLT